MSVQCEHCKRYGNLEWLNDHWCPVFPTKESLEAADNANRCDCMYDHYGTHAVACSSRREAR